MVEFITMAPTSGDGQHVGTVQQKGADTLHGKEGEERPPTFDYIKSIAQAAEQGGFSTLLLPTGEACLDSLAVASNLISHTEELKFLFAARPGSMSPATFAKQFSTVHYWSGGRVLANIVTGGSPVELASQGDFLDHSTRYRRTHEYIQVLKKYFRNERFSHEGEFYTLENAKLFPSMPYVPDIYFGGASDVGKEVAAQEADVYMLWGETLKETAERITDVKKRAAKYGRKLQYSISFQVILGETEEAAFQHANALLKNITASEIKHKKDTATKGESVGVNRLYDLMEKSKDQQFVIGPNLWAGLAQVLPGNSIALVGTPEQVADRLVAFTSLGFDKVLLRGFPHLETIQQVGELVIPKVKEKLAAKQFA